MNFRFYIYSVSYITWFFTTNQRFIFKLNCPSKLLTTVSIDATKTNFRLRNLKDNFKTSDFKTFIVA